MLKRIPTALLAPLAVAAVALAVPRPAAADFGTYLALGDSLAFGESQFQYPNGPVNGDNRGYVGPFADYLAGLNGGVRPSVINLAVDGETSSTFVHGGTPGPGPSPGSPAYGLNTNYAAPFPSQYDLMNEKIAATQASGHGVGVVTIQLGANDLYALTNDPSFFAETPAQQLAQVQSTLATVQANLFALLATLHSAVPGATLVLLGYYDPFAPFAHDPTSPLFPISQLSGPAIQGLNQVLAGEAAAFGATYVDLFTPFVGHELAYTFVADNGNVHPTPAGYAVIAQQLEAAVPEPSSLLLLAAGAAGLLGLNRQRRRAGLQARAI
jgi:lysophospholipase L1-like esterase